MPHPLWRGRGSLGTHSACDRAGTPALRVTKRAARHKTWSAEQAASRCTRRRKPAQVTSRLRKPRECNGKERATHGHGPPRRLPAAFDAQRGTGVGLANKPAINQPRRVRVLSRTDAAPGACGSRPGRCLVSLQPWARRPARVRSGQVRSGQVRFITRPKSRTMRSTRELMLPPSTVS